MKNCRFARLVAMTAALFSFTIGLSIDIPPGHTERVSVSAEGPQANGDSSYAEVTADGRFVVFLSAANNLGPSDTNAKVDVYIKNLATGEVRLVSTRKDGVQGNGDALSPYPTSHAVSEDGRRVAFISASTNLVPNDTNGVIDLFVKDLETGELKRASVSTGGSQATADTYHFDLSGDGRFVVFWNGTDGLVSGDNNGVSDVFVKNIDSGELLLASINADGTRGDAVSGQPSINRDGSLVAFATRSKKLAGVVSKDEYAFVLLKNMLTGAMVLVSTTADGSPALTFSTRPRISPTGRYILFWSDPVVYGLPGGRGWHLLKDLNSGQVSIASGPSGNVAHWITTTMSANERFILFPNWDKLDEKDTNGKTDLYVRDLLTDSYTLVSKRTDGSQSENDVVLGSISGDGRYVAFHTASSFSWGDTNGFEDAFVHNTGLWTPARTFLSVLAPTSYIGKKTSFVATLRERGTLKLLAGESVRFFLDGTKIGEGVTNADGKAVLPYLISEGFGLGSHQLQVRFLGNSNYRLSSNSATFEVKKGPVKVQVASKSAIPGAKISLVAKLTNQAGQALSGRTIRFSLNGELIGTTVTNATGLAGKSCTVPFTAGSYPVTVEFAGDDKHTAGVGTGTLTVN